MMNTARQLYPIRLMFHCDPEIRDGVNEFASKERITRAEALRRLLRKALKDERVIVS